MKEHKDDAVSSGKESTATVVSTQTTRVEVVTEIVKTEVISGERDGEVTMAEDSVSVDRAVDVDGATKVDLGANIGSNGKTEEGSERETGTGDHVMEDVGVVNEGNDDADESRVKTSEKDEMVVSEESVKGSVEVVKETVQESVVTTVGCDDQKSGNEPVVEDSKIDCEPLGKEAEAGGGEIEMRESGQNVFDGDHVMNVKTEEETEVISSSNLSESTEGHVVIEEVLVGEDKTEDAADNQNSSKEVVDTGRCEDNAHEITKNMENQAGVDQTKKESVQSTNEATPDDPEKSGDGIEVGESKRVVDLERGVAQETVERPTESVQEAADQVLGSKKILDSVTEVVEVVANEGLAGKDETQDGVAEDQSALCSDSDKPNLSSEIVNTGNAENLGQNAEVNQENKEISRSTTEVRTHDTSESGKETEEGDSKRGDKPEIIKGETDKMDDKPEIIKGETDVMDEGDKPELDLEQPVKSVQEVVDEDRHSSKISHSSIMVSLGLEEEVDVVVVDEGLEGKNEAHDGVSVEPTDLVNVATAEIDQKAEVDSTSKDGNSFAAIEPDEDAITQKEQGSDVQISTDVVEDQSKPDVVAFTDQGLNANHSNWGSDITAGRPQTHTDHPVLPATSEFLYEEAHLERGEDAGMDIDEVLGWKDEHESKVDPTNLSTFALQETEAYVSLHQSCYFHPPETEGEFSVSDLVWGKVKSHPWWPGQIFDPSDASEKAMKHHKKDCFLVAYFGDRSFAWNDSTVLKPFREKFSQIVQHSDSEAFNNAVHCALQEVSRRVELGLACSCISPDIYENIKCQIVENSGIKQESSRRNGVDKSASVNSFEPCMLVDYVRLLAKFPHGAGDKMELTMAKAQLSSYGRFKGHRQLAEFQLGGDLLEAKQVVKDETESEDGSRKRKALDSISDEKPPFKVASQLPEAAEQVPGYTVPMQSVGPQADMLSQLHLAAQDPMKGHSFTDNILPFFNSHRTAVLTKSRLSSPNDASKKRKTSNENEREGFEIDDVNDSYWTDRVIQNVPEENLLQENQNQNQNQNQIQNQNGGGAHQVVAYEQERQPAKPARRSNKKRFFSSNHEIEAKEQSELIERRRKNLATEVLMKFTEGIYFPSEIHLNKMFKRFGPLVESETEVDRQGGRARVVFKKCSDAEVAHSSAGKINIFGSISVTYELNYTPLISYKPLPLPVAQDPPHAC